MSEVEPLSGVSVTADDLLALAAAAERPSEHPLAYAVVAAAQERGLPLLPVEDFTSYPGRGVTATVSGQVVRVGSPVLLAEVAPRTAPDLLAEARARVGRLEDEGRTAVVILRDGTPAGVLALADRLRPDARDAVAALTALTGRAPVLLTGDNPGAAGRLADEVGIIDVRAGLLPQTRWPT